MPKVLYVIDTLEIGGAERSLLEIARRLAWEPAVVTCYRGDSLRREYEAAGMRVHALDVAGDWSLAAVAAGLRRLAAAERPQVVHALLARAGFAARLARSRLAVPLIDSFVSLPYSAAARRLQSPLRRAKGLVVRLLDAATVSRVDRFVAVSAVVRDENCRALGLSPARVTVIPRGRDPGLFEPRPEFEPAALRRALDLDGASAVLLTACRLLASKGLPELLRAIAFLREQRPLVLLIAGEGPARADLESLRAGLGLERQVRLLGSRRDVADLLQLADLFVFPSHFEGHPGALVEAMLAGRPIVASDTPVHRESVVHGETARLFRVGDAAALAREIDWLLSRRPEAEAMGRRARQEACRRFDIRTVAAAHDALYESVAAAQSEREAKR